MQDAAQTQSGSTAGAIDKPWIRDLDIALRNEDHKAAYEALTKYATSAVAKKGATATGTLVEAGKDAVDRL